MLLCHVGQVAQRLANSPVFSDPFWQLDTAELRASHLLMFRARMSAAETAREGDEAFALLQTEALKHSNKVGPSMLLGLNGAEPRFMVDELIYGLAKMSEVRAQATIYALEERLTPEEVMGLTWKRVLGSVPRGQLSIDLIRRRNRNRHIRLHYVFWEFATPTIAAPLLELRTDAAKRSTHIRPLFQAGVFTVQTSQFLEGLPHAQI